MQLENKFLVDYRRMFRLLESGGTFVAFDTETTGLSPLTATIIEIGAVRFNRHGIISKYNTLINPQKSIPWKITDLTGISNDMVQGMPHIKDVLKEFLPFLADSIIIGHNVQFDLRFLKHECELNGFTYPENQVIDNLRFSRWAFPEEQKFNQEIMAERLGIQIKEAHRAYDDAEVCGNIFLSLIKHTADRQKI